MTHGPLDIAMRNQVIGHLNAEEIPLHLIDDALVDELMPEYLDSRIRIDLATAAGLRKIAQSGLTPDYRHLQMQAASKFAQKAADLQQLRAKYP